MPFTKVPLVDIGRPWPCQGLNMGQKKELRGEEGVLPGEEHSEGDREFGSLE